MPSEKEILTQQLVTRADALQEAVRVYMGAGRQVSSQQRLDVLYARVAVARTLNQLEALEASERAANAIGGGPQSNP